MYLAQCKTCSIQYVGSTKNKARARLNNYKSQYRKYVEQRDNKTLGVGKAVPQAHFHAHFAQHDHHGIDDMSFKLIDTARTEEELRRRESFWIYKLTTMSPRGLNVRDVVTQLDQSSQPHY